MLIDCGRHKHTAGHSLMCDNSTAHSNRVTSTVEKNWAALMWIALNFDAWLWSLCSCKMERTTTMTIHFHVRIQTQSLNWMFMIFYTLRGEDVAVWGLPVPRMKDVWYWQLKTYWSCIDRFQFPVRCSNAYDVKFPLAHLVHDCLTSGVLRADVSWLNSFKVSWNG